ncbi:MAG: carbamoyltransferase HypF [Clostridiales bacterium]|jgi:hydrogenase maturation protein HypF|nr:carbamoyltransferase HypF [Eubacteriales bacterium]MDH7564914.1 carbamoyltransferase HypF [Clostridiales bacterium]
MESVRYLIKITGIVQGVGFRPFVYNLAKSQGLRGWVRNESGGVIIDIEGEKDSIEVFKRKLKEEAPPLSHIKRMDVSKEDFIGYGDFIIRHSDRTEADNIYISPDIGVCPDCRRELFEKTDRRYLYPFINCTNCGPRFTIVTGIPYDRVNTTMRKFPMCPKCASEYNDPQNRRYHAQPVSCQDCGPRLMLLDNKGNELVKEDLLEYTCRLLQKGSIVAIKGLGGYHLACNAYDERAVARLRRRKIRDDKPFAVMVRDYETAVKHCYVDAHEKVLLESEKKPIVLLKKRESLALSREVAPMNPCLGLMLPYTPVHLLLFHYLPCDLDTIVMTSANRSSEPIYYKDDEAVENLRDIADYFLTNDRDIHIRTDDSVTRVYEGREYIIRRARGYAPRPITCDFLHASGKKRRIPPVLACGGELKNTFCLGKNGEFYMSHHIGDLENAETLASFEQGIQHYKRLFGVDCDIIAYDLHPEYLSTKYAVSTNIGRKMAIQHHHAHIASCMAENNVEEDVIGVAFDGTGYGEDGHIWGGEFFTGGYTGFKRMGHLAYVGMPGGDFAVKEPWRMAISYLYNTVGNLKSLVHEDGGIKLGDLKVLNGVGPEKISAVIGMLEKNINTHRTSSMGRLFDGVSALLGIRDSINYEGQAAIELEFAAEAGDFGEYGFDIEEEKGVFIIHPNSVIDGIIGDLKAGIPRGIISSRFHETVATMIKAMCMLIREEQGLDRVALSGGVFQNMTLLEKSITRLRKEGFKVYIHSRVPSNDGGIALGQAVMAVCRAMKEEGKKF